MVALALFAAPGFASAATPPPPAACTELVVDGGFETGGAWQLGVSPVPPQVVTYAFHSGTRSLQMGITSGANVESFSSARQMVSIPPGAAQVTLSFWYYAIAEAPATTDYMEVALLSADGSAILAKPWFSHNDSRLWNQTAFDLTAWRGRTIQLYFNVYNDGVGGRAAMFLDDVSLSTCPAPATIPAVTATPTRTPSAPVPTCAPVCTPAAPCIPVCTPAAPCTSGCTPAAPCIPGCTPLAPVPTSTRTPTKAPTVAPTAAPTMAPTAAPTVGTGCVEMTQNGGFESGIAGWIPGNSPLPPLLITNPVLGGSYSLQLGSQIQNLNAFSSIRQTVTVPWGYARAIVDFWAYTWAESSAGSDRQQFVVLGPGNVVWAVPWQVLENERVWKSHTFDLSNMIGKTFDLYFAAVNDGKGGRTMLLLDEVHLWACAGNAYPSTGSPPPVAGAAPPPPPPPQAVGYPTVQPAATLSVVQVTPVETLSAAQVTPVETIPNTEGLVISVTSLPPGPMWTEVAISGASAPNAASRRGRGGCFGLNPYA